MLKGGLPFAPVRTYMTFFDFDTGLPQLNEQGGEYYQSQTEVFQMSPDAAELILYDGDREIEQQRVWAPDVVEPIEFDETFNASASELEPTSSTDAHRSHTARLLHHARQRLRATRLHKLLCCKLLMRERRSSKWHVVCVCVCVCVAG